MDKDIELRFIQRAVETSPETATYKYILQHRYSFQNGEYTTQWVDVPFVETE